MCGIIGIIDRHGATARIEGAAFRRGLAALHHRGPDAHGTAEVVAARSVAHFGHARLAILDLSPAAAQPMQRREGRHTLVFNGEVYNFKDLRAELARQGAHFVSDGDTEVVFEALMRWGPAAVERFVGMFALAWWDRDTETLLLVRDRLGIKPLYWRLDGARLAFASEVRALVAAGLAPVPDGRDKAAVAAWADTGACADPDTLVPGVQNLLPGHTLIWQAGSAPRTHRYWEPQPLQPKVLDPVAAVAETLDMAVRDRLVSDVPLGVFLSGGVDSAAIAAVAARHLPETLETFTLAFPEGAFDESDRARRLARHLGVRHHVATITPDEALAAVEPAFAAQDLPSHDGVNTWLVSRAARQAGLVVCLSGTGGDELFSGYSHFHNLSRLLAPGRIGRWVPPGLAAIVHERLPRAVPTRIQKALALLGTGGEVERVAAVVRQVFSPAQVAALMGEPNIARPATVPMMAPGLDAVGRLSVAELGGYLRNTQLRDIDAMSMAHGLEVRVPLLDHRLVALALSLPAGVKAPVDGLNKPLLVAAAGLPRELMRAPKMGFVLPWEHWLRGPLRAFAEHALFAPSPAPLRPAAVRALWGDFLARRPSVNAVRILALMSLRLWYQRLQQQV